LHWNSYEGFLFSKYYIYRGSNESNLVLYDSTDINTLNYTDNNISQLYYYQIRVEKSTGGCYSLITSSVQKYSSSNILPGTAGLASANELIPNFMIAVSPNPTMGKINIQASEKISSIAVTDIFGETVYISEVNALKSGIDGSASLTINLSSQPKGIYFVEMMIGNTRRTEKIIIE
jgi:hypothetical protein